MLSPAEELVVTFVQPQHEKITEIGICQLSACKGNKQLIYMQLSSNLFYPSVCQLNRTRCVCLHIQGSANGSPVCIIGLCRLFVIQPEGDDHCHLRVSVCEREHVKQSGFRLLPPLTCTQEELWKQLGSITSGD